MESISQSKRRACPYSREPSELSISKRIGSSPGPNSSPLRVTWENRAFSPHALSTPAPSVKV